MGLFSFIKDAGEKIFGDDEPAQAPAAKGAPAPTRGAGLPPDVVRAQALARRIEATGIAVEDLKIRSHGDTVQISGRVPTQADKEKLVLLCGNARGVAKVEEDLEVERQEPAATFYTVKSGDTLSKIARTHYGEASKYPQIFEANQPMLAHPDKIYPGQVLRIPPEA
jgi:nucleoid-associated protein YgaU